MPEKLFIGRNNEMSRRFYEEIDGVKTYKNLSTSTKIELKFFKNPESIIIKFDDTTNPALFDKTGAATGIIVFKPEDDTFSAVEDKIIDDENMGTLWAQYIIYTTLQPDGVVFPEFEVGFEKF